MALDLLSKLRKSKLVVTEAQSHSFPPGSSTNYVQPSKAWFVGPEYRHKGRSLITTERFAETIASQSYNVEAQIGLIQLDARTLNDQNFVDELEVMLLEDESKVQEQSSDWHERLALILLRIVLSDWNLCRRCTVLCLIPLWNGEWTSAEDGNISLPRSSSRKLLGGLEEIQFVGFPGTDMTKIQRQLFKELGVQKLKSAPVCDAITREHKTRSSWSKVHLIDHARYLFEAGYHRKPADKLLFYDSESFSTTDHGAVIPFGEPGSRLRETFGQTSPTIRWLHDDYESAVDTANLDEWCAWLAGWPAVSRWLPIEQNGRLSAAMKQLYETRGFESFLRYLEERQSHIQYLPRKCKDEIRSLTVDSTSGSCRLQETVLPCLREHAGHVLPVLKLSWERESHWDFLQQFGVLIEINVTFLLEKLKRMKSLRLTRSGQSVTLSDIDEVYRQISEFPDDFPQVW